jgi:hypothetical protein
MPGNQSDSGPELHCPRVAKLTPEMKTVAAIASMYESKKGTIKAPAADFQQPDQCPRLIG